MRSLKKRLAYVALAALVSVPGIASAHPASESEYACHRHSVPKLIRCIARKVGVSPDKAVRVADCETGGTFDPRIRSSNGLYYGLYQFDKPTWRSAKRTYLKPGQRVRAKWYRARWNTLVALKKAKREGWRAWPYCGRK